MDMLNTIMLLAADSPVTGDRFPVIPLIIGACVAAGIAVVSTILAGKKKDDDDDE